ncbi:MAG: hypothetical protein K2L17_07250 [Muribaculaceae bacterium]|nr:hypothetical protein [Muribaculaceae bacterium]
MKKILSAICFVSAVAITASAAELYDLPAGSVTDIAVEKSESQILVKFTVHPEAFPKMSNREVWLVPYIEGGGQQLRLDSVLVAGRTRYIQHQRGNNRLSENTVLLRAGAKDIYEYSIVAPYSNWMAYSSLGMEGRVIGCAGCGILPLLTFADEQPLARMDYRDMTVVPMMVYVSPEREIIKTRDVSKEAYIDFPVGKMEIYPDYRRNPEELAAIRHDIDVMQSDEDITINSVTFTGYASPEGSYTLNEKLAKGRTEALLDYVTKYFDVPRKALEYSWVAEDWAGLEERVKGMDDLRDKEALLQLISDDSIDPDAKDQRLKTEFPDDYFILLTKVYPALRHTVYKVNYTVKNFTDLQKIAVLLETAPQKLSLDEIYLYAQTLDKNSQQFREVMEVAVRMFPNDEVANLNAAATAVTNGDYAAARKYLSKAGNRPEATYTEAAIAVRNEDYATAVPLLNSAAAAGIQEATDLLGELRFLGLIE